MKKLTSAEDAIKQAIEGGWGSPYVNKLVDFVVRGENVDFECKDGTIIKVSLNDIFTDPLFWTALGKVRGWCKDEVTEYGSCTICGMENCDNNWPSYAGEWFGGIRMSNGDETKFWESLK